ncbi:uncharacterized protein LOC126683886 isoform X2 [Mercurialis annua]|uniref:uncharacterized protein LOC126683886 isoform X2 n=1 Tax=Mercurialis annua TaxID=3986 RepID=UPI00216032B3|nr:uncharacterized protein LOC126683886 isoform X2 [Mercurialis annua]
MSGEEEAWEEALDLDDSDISPLRPFKRQTTTSIVTATATSSPPFLQRCSTSLSQPSQNPKITQTLPSQFHPPPPLPPTPPSRIISGPAGTLQSAMLRRRQNQHEQNGLHDSVIMSTQEYVRRAVEVGVEDDDDFTRAPWLFAVQFIRLQDGDGAIGIPLTAIKNMTNFDNKLPQIVAIVKSCTLNGFGDMMVALKDPTGTIDATIHRRVLTETEFGKDISVGAVIVVQKVAVFSPARSVHYLNITHSNLIKVIPKDTGVSLEQNSSAQMAKHAASVSEHNQNSWNPQKQISPSQGRTEGIMSSLRQDDTHDEHTERHKETRRSCESKSDVNNENQNVIAEKEILLAHEEDVADGFKEATNAYEAVSCEVVKPSSQAGRGNVVESVRYGSGAADSVNASDNQESGEVDGTKCRQKLISSVALPQWTDEQLDELFIFD